MVSLRRTTNLVSMHLMAKKSLKFWGVIVLAMLGVAVGAHASEADIKIPDLTKVTFDGLGGVSGIALMYFGIFMCAIGAR